MVNFFAVQQLKHGKPTAPTLTHSHGGGGGKGGSGGLGGKGGGGGGGGEGAGGDGGGEGGEGGSTLQAHLRAMRVGGGTRASMACRPNTAFDEARKCCAGRCGGGCMRAQSRPQSAAGLQACQWVYCAAPGGTPSTHQRYTTAVLLLSRKAAYSTCTGSRPAAHATVSSAVRQDCLGDEHKAQWAHALSRNRPRESARCRNHPQTPQCALGLAMVDAVQERFAGSASRWRLRDAASPRAPSYRISSCCSRRAGHARISRPAHVFAVERDGHGGPGGHRGGEGGDDDVGAEGRPGVAVGAVPQDRGVVLRLRDHLVGQVRHVPGVEGQAGGQGDLGARGWVRRLSVADEQGQSQGACQAARP